MLGVAGVGLYALYRAVSNPPAQPATTNTNAAPLLPPGPPAPAPPAPPNPGLPDRATPITAPAGAIFGAGGPGQGDVMTLDNSRAYRGRGEDVREEDLGFLDAVRIFNTAAEARAAGFPEWALAGPSRVTRWFYGRFTYPDAQYRKPAKIEAMWLLPGQTTRLADGTLGRATVGYAMPQMYRFSPRPRRFF